MCAELDVVDVKVDEEEHGYVILRMTWAQHKAYLQGRGLSLPKGGEEALRKYESTGMQILVAEVAASKAKPVCRTAITSEWSPKMESPCAARDLAAT